MQQNMMRSLLVQEKTLGNTLSRLTRYWWYIWQRTPLHHPRKLIPYASTLLFLLAMLPGEDVSANIRIPHIEWLDAIPEVAIKADNNEHVLHSGEVSSSVLQTMGFSLQDVLDMSKASQEVFSFNRMREGHRLQRHDGKNVIRVWYDIDSEQRLQLLKIGQKSWQASVLVRPLQRYKRHAQGVIHQSLFIDAGKAGLDDRTTMALIDVFAWDIDFARNLRKGDRFDVYYEEAYDHQGELVATNILAAEFINRGQHYSAVRYNNATGKPGYYALNGANLKKDFLKAPLKYSRISSRFSGARKHPVLGYTRAHKGVDYAAPSGTPIHAVGDGVVEVASRHGGYGRYIRIRHHHGINTRYGHLRRYAKGLHRGSRVHQGQVIGYVGMSGLATGPHLHFEYRKGNKAINPLKVSRQAGEPIASKEMARFRSQTKPVWQQLQQYVKAQQQVSWG